ncbi:hypothetical protein ACROYT_G043307 [Oculina patagonica]
MKIQGSPAAFTVDDAQAAINRWRWKVHPYEKRRDLHQSQRDITLQQQLNIKCTGLEDNFGDRIFFSRRSFIIKNKPTR